MTIDNVTPFVGPPRPPDTLETHFGSDAWKLKICAQWRSLRAQQQKNWAEHDLASGWGYLESSDLNLEPLQRMQEIEYHLADFEPSTVLLARELLHVCITILANQKEDPESVLADGPVLEIIRNVVEALGFLSGNTRLGPVKENDL